jgi:NDP-sugar pyrophosphorylase family protein
MEAVGGKLKAIILAAGYGTRMGNLTQDIPKPMLDVQGHPILEYIIRQLVRHHFTQIVINQHFMPHIIQEFFDDGSRWGANLSYSYEHELLGTAGGVKNVESFFDGEDAFLIHYGDVLTNQDFTNMYDYHLQHKALATLLLHQRVKSNSIVTLDEENHISNFLERPTEDQRKGVKTPWVNSGIYICSPEIFDFIPKGQFVDMPRHVFVPQVCSRRLFGFPLSGYRCAIDSPQRLEEARHALVEGKNGLPIFSV